MTKITILKYCLLFFLISTTGIFSVFGKEKKDGALPFPKRFFYGSKAGGGSTFMSHHHLYMQGESRVTFSVGVFGEYKVSPWISFNVSAEYTHNGGSDISPRLIYEKNSPMLGISETGQTLVRTNLTIHSIELPITIRMTIPLKQSAFEPFFIAGPALGYNFHARADNYYVWDYGGNVPNDLISETSDFVIDRLKPIYISVFTGFGTVIHTGRRCDFEIGLNFRLGMSNENKFEYSLYPSYCTVSTIGYVGIRL